MKGVILMDKNIIIGNRIDEAIKRRNVTRVDVAKIIGKNKSTITRYISGETKGINMVILEKIANYLEVNPVWLAGHDAPMEIEKALNYGGSANGVVTMDDFTYALFNETKDLNDTQKEALLAMAKALKESK